MLKSKFIKGDKVLVTGRRKVYTVLGTNVDGNKIQIEADGVKEWVYADWLKLYESISLIYKAIVYIISLFKKKKP